MFRTSLIGFVNKSDEVNPNLTDDPTVILKKRVKAKRHFICEFNPLKLA